MAGPVSPDLLMGANPYTAGAQALGAALSGGTSSASNETGSVGSGVAFNIGVPNRPTAGFSIPQPLLIGGAAIAALLVVVLAVKK